MSNYESLSRLRKVYENQLEQRNQRVSQRPSTQSKLSKPNTSDILIEDNLEVDSRFHTQPVNVSPKIGRTHSHNYGSADSRGSSKSRKSKPRKVQFTEVYDSKSISDIKNERASREADLKNFRQKSNESNNGRRTNLSRILIADLIQDQRSLGDTPEGSVLAKLNDLTDQKINIDFGFNRQQTDNSLDVINEDTGREGIFHDPSFNNIGAKTTTDMFGRGKHQV